MECGIKAVGEKIEEMQRESKKKTE